MDLLAAATVIVNYIDGSDRSLVKLLHALHVITDAVWNQVEVTNPADIIAKIKEAEEQIIHGQVPAWVLGAIQYGLGVLSTYLKSK